MTTGETTCTKLTSARYTLAWLSFLGFCVVYMLRVNLSVALVAMVRPKQTNSSNFTEECSDHGSANKTSENGAKNPEFDWGRDLQGYILGSFFYGYIITQIPGGWLAGKYGGKKILGFGVFCTAVLTLLTPPAANWSPYALILVRVLEGVGEGVTFPAMHAMWAEWAPPLERSKLVTLSYAGPYFGTVIGLPLTGIITSSIGWSWVFYIFGIVGIVWFAFWMIIVSDKPSQHQRISKSEKLYIINEINKTKSSDEPITLMNTPWLQIFTSPAVLALCVAHFAHNWGFYTLLTCLPTYIQDVLHYDISADALISAAPYLFMWLAVWFGGVMVDILREKKIVSTKAIRKIVLAIGLLVPAACLAGVGYVGCNFLWALVLLCIAGAFDGISLSGYNVNHLDIGPRYAGTLMGITNSIATIPGFLGPQVAGWLTKEASTSIQWRYVFFISSGIYVVGVIIFCIFAQGEVQPWALHKKVVDFAKEEEVTLINTNSETDE